MLRFQPLIVMGLGALVCVPLGAQGETLFEQLRGQLTRTETALSELKSLERNAEFGAAATLEQLRPLSETPAAPPDLAQLRLEGLQLEVRELGVQLDTLRARRGVFPEQTLSSSQRLDQIAESSPLTHGLDPNMRQALARQLGLESGPSIAAPDERMEKNDKPMEDSKPASSEPPAQASNPLEATDGTAGPIDVLAEWRAAQVVQPPEQTVTALGKARAQYRAGHIAEALRGFEALADNPEAVFWAARSLERMGETDRALERYRQLDMDETRPALRERAQEAIEFLEWKSTLNMDSKSGKSGR